MRDSLLTEWCHRVIFYLEKQERAGRLGISALPKWAVTKAICCKCEMSFSQWGSGGGGDSDTGACNCQNSPTVSLRATPFSECKLYLN